MLYARQEFENFAQKFTAEGDTRIAQAVDRPRDGEAELRRRRCDDGGLPGAARRPTRSRSTKTAFKKDIDFIRAMIRFRIDEAVFGIADARRHLIAVDPQAQVALTEFGEAQKLLELAQGEHQGEGRH